MTVSSNPHGERPGTRGSNWEQRLVSLGEVVVDTDRDESPFGWSESNPPTPKPNRKTRRAMQRTARRTK